MNKGFNWFYVVILIALGMLFYPMLNSSSSVKPIDEDTFFGLMQQGKIKEIKVYRDTHRADIFLTSEARKKSENQKDVMLPFSQGANPDLELSYGDLKYLQERFHDIKKTNPEIKTIINFEDSGSAMKSSLISMFMWIAFSALLYYFIFRRMGGGGGGGNSSMFNIGRSKAKLINEKDAVITFKDVAGLEGAKEEVQEVLAKAVAGEAKVPFFSLSGSDFVEMFVGVGASRVRDLFAQAKAKSPAIIFIDEIDAIGRARSKSNFSGANDERENTLNQLLTEMDGFGTDTNVIVMAATNRADILDKALLRAGRFDREIYVDLPEVHERKEIFEVHLKKIKLDDSVDKEFLAKQTPGFSGADIANLCNEAALIAARNNHESVTKQDFLDAVDRIIGGLEKKSLAIKPSEKRRIAIHEAGHATISWLTEHANPLLKVTIVPRGRSLGAAWYLPEERQLTTTEQILDEMCATLGGRAAEQVVYNNISTGALSDLEKVTKRAQAMVTVYGLNDKIGNISYYDSSGQSEYNFGKPYSEHTAKTIDEEISKIVENQYQRAIRILTENRDKLEALADKLIEKEVIFREDLEEIFGKRAWEPEVAETSKKEEQNPIPAENSTPPVTDTPEEEKPSENDEIKDSQS